MRTKKKTIDCRLGVILDIKVSFIKQSIKFGFKFQFWIQTEANGQEEETRRTSWANLFAY